MPMTMMMTCLPKFSAAVRPILGSIQKSPTRVASISSSLIQPPSQTKKSIGVRFLSITTTTTTKIQHEIAEANERRQGSVQIRTTIDGRGYGVFARRRFEAGETVIEAISLKSFGRPTSHTIQTGRKTHVHVDLPARFLNHMCDPNLTVELNRSGAYDFVARTGIEEGDEVGFDYETTEYELGEPIRCGCGSPDKCREVVGGFRRSQDAIMKIYGKNGVSSYLLSYVDA